MMEKTEPPNKNHSDQSEVYAHGYESALTLKLHASRTADKQVGWFLPYLQPGMALLDCGCATGSITLGLAKVVAPGQVTGVDISEIEIERAQVRAAEAGLTNIRFAVGNIYQLDFPNNSFDALFSHNVLEHVGEPGRALREMYRVLKPGGVIGIRDTDMGGALLAPPDKWTEQSAAIFEVDWEGVGGHPRLGRRLGGLLIEAGFVEVEASASYEVFSNLEGRRLLGQIAVSRWTEADFVKRIIERGLASYDDIEPIKEAWRAWQELPDAFFANAHGEAVGRKA